jgi:hypothetical protein
MYDNSRGARYITMRSKVTRAAVFALYQLSLLAGIALLPVALLLRKMGITIPVHRLVDRFNEAYEAAGGRTQNGSAA